MNKKPFLYAALAALFLVTGVETGHSQNINNMYDAQFFIDNNTDITLKTGAENLYAVMGGTYQDMAVIWLATEDSETGETMIYPAVGGVGDYGYAFILMDIDNKVDEFFPDFNLIELGIAFFDPEVIDPGYAWTDKVYFGYMTTDKDIGLLRAFFSSIDDDLLEAVEKFYAYFEKRALELESEINELKREQSRAR